MRTKQEINLAIDLLNEYGGEFCREQAHVLRNRMSESQVFEAYVYNMPQEQKNEALFFAARDAAQYISGKLTISELIPNLPDSVSEELMQQKKEEEKDTVTLSYREFQNLQKRVERLERRLGLRAEINKVTRKDAAEAPSDLISQAEVCRLLGCGKSTIKRWADKGLVTGYKKGKNVYYSKHGLMRSDVVKEYQATKTE